MRELIRSGLSVLTFNQRSVDEILAMIAQLGALVGECSGAERLIEELQRILAKRHRTLPEPGDAPGLSVTWPWVGNAISFRGYDQFAGAGAERFPYVWVDESKRTT